MSMDTEELTVAVRVLQDSLASLSSEQVRMREASAYLEQRVRELERRGAGGQPAPAAANGAGAAPAPGAKEEEEEEGKGSAGAYIETVEHSIGETLWEAPLIVGLPGLRPLSSGLLLVSLLLNATVQTYLCVVLLTSGDFIQPDRFNDLEGPMHHWRTTTAHNYGELDAAGTTLVSRVCGGDESLATAVSQGNLLTEINSYLGLEPLQLEPQGFGTGPLLCMMCIFLFTGLVMKELRSLAVSILAICSVPSGATRLEDDHLVALSPTRFAVCMAVNVARAGIAIMLLYTGIFWLAGTTSITDLILNAAALGFVMDLDEILFDTVVPATVQIFVQKMEPVKFKRLRGSLEAVVPLLAIIFIAFLSGIFLIGPNIKQMVVVKSQLCAGNLDFATARSPANYVISVPTLPFDGDAEPNLEQRAVQELVDAPVLGEGTVYFSMWAPIRSYASQYIRRTLEEQAEATRCVDQDDLYTHQTEPWLFSFVRSEMGVDAGISVAERPFRCADYANRCQVSGLLKMVCPITCGCDDPKSGLMLVSAAWGCPQACALVRRQRLRTAACVDDSVANTRNWKSYWRAYEGVVSRGASLDATQRNALDAWIGRKIGGGCNNTEIDQFFGADFCDHTHQMFAVQGVQTIIGVCPATCCGGLPPSATSPCPSTC